MVFYGSYSIRSDEVRQNRLCSPHSFIMIDAVIPFRHTVPVTVGIHDIICL